MNVNNNRLNQAIKPTTQEPQMPLKAKRYPSLTPEQVEMSRQRRAETSKMIVEALHQDNQEIFGQDYDKKT